MSDTVPEAAEPVATAAAPTPGTPETTKGMIADIYARLAALELAAGIRTMDPDAA